MDVIPPNMDILIDILYFSFPPNMDVIQENQGWWDILIHLSGASIFPRSNGQGKATPKNSWFDLLLFQQVYGWFRIVLRVDLDSFRIHLGFV